MTGGAASTVALPDSLAGRVRIRLGMRECTRDIVVPLGDMVTALGDGLPLSTLSTLISGRPSDALVTLRADGRLDAVTDTRTMQLAS